MFGFDSDYTPVQILRFPGVPDAYAGTTRGMLGEVSWIEFGLPGGQEKYAERYQIVLGKTSAVRSK